MRMSVRVNIRYRGRMENINSRTYANKFISQSDNDLKRYLSVHSVAGPLPEVIIKKTH